MFPTPYFVCLPDLIKVMVLIVVSLGAFIGLEFSKFFLNYDLKSISFLSSRLFFSSIWNLPYLSTFGVNYYPIYLGGVYYKRFDHGWSEFFGRQNIYLKMRRCSSFFHVLFNNNLKIYMSFLVIWIFWLVVFFYLNSLF